MIQQFKNGYISNPQQIYTLRRTELLEGKAKGCEIIEVCTANGLQIDILPDTGLDIGQVRYKGINMTYISKNGYDSPTVIMPYETEFSNTFPGGLLYTCGLRNAGPANRDNGEWHPLHGRYHGLSAEQVSANAEDGEITVKGILRETSLFGHALELRRTIRIPIYGAEITVEDSLTNMTSRDEEVMRLYHCNFGFPLLSESAKLILPEKRETISRTEFARVGLGKECTFVPPVDGEEEQVFFHKLSQYHAALQNSALGVEMLMTWSGDTLPILAQWRSMASGDYVLGLEPSNCYIMGRNGERLNGSLSILKGFETQKTTIQFKFSEIGGIIQ